MLENVQKFGCKLAAHQWEASYQELLELFELQQWRSQKVFLRASIVSKSARAKFFTATPPSITSAARVQWRSISMSRHNFTACNSKNLSRNLPVQLFISISCSIVSEKLANSGIVWLSNGKGGGASR